MSDLLVRLYDLPVFEAEEKVRSAGIVVRRGLSFRAPRHPGTGSASTSRNLGCPKRRWRSASSRQPS